MSKVGVIVGRFQVAMLHEGHKKLINTAIEENDLLIIFIGVSAIQGTKRNPLDYTTVNWMLDNYLKDSELLPYMILPLPDNESDQKWVQNLDNMIKLVTKYTDQVMLYSGDDGFWSTYYKNEGNYECKTIVRDNNVSGTNNRQESANTPWGTEDFRSGVIYATLNQRNVCLSTVDMACIKVTEDDNLLVLVGKKPGETLYRFPGGFADPTDENLENSARREFAEETGLIIEDTIQYVGSTRVDDWRFNQSPDKTIMTTLFAHYYSFGTPNAGDDLEVVEWIELSENSIPLMNKGHQKLMKMLIEWL